MMSANELIESHMGLIKSIATKFYNQDKEDLVQAGVIGLLKAYKNYRHMGDTKFSTYAYKYIFGEMYQLSITNRDIKVSKELLKVYKAVEHTRYELAQRLNRVPTNLEVAEFLEMDIAAIELAVASSEALIRLDDEASDLNLHEMIPSNSNTNIDNTLDIELGISSLNEEERQIIEDRYFKDLTQSEVARRLNMTQVMVSRYEKKSLEKMRAIMS